MAALRYVRTALKKSREKPEKSALCKTANEPWRPYAFCCRMLHRLARLWINMKTYMNPKPQSVCRVWPKPNCLNVLVLQITSNIQQQTSVNGAGGI